MTFLTHAANLRNPSGNSSGVRNKAAVPNSIAFAETGMA
jgi:hypothetical protein